LLLRALRVGRSVHQKLRGLHANGFEKIDQFDYIDAPLSTLDLGYVAWLLPEPSRYIALSQSGSLSGGDQPLNEALVTLIVQ
jgi:hypothetical protein